MARPNAKLQAVWQKVQRFDLYSWILSNLTLFLLILIAVPALAWWARGWNLVPEVQLLLIAIAAVPPIAKWFNESVERLIDKKPIVLSERCSDGSYEIRNVGGGLAVNVWYFGSANDLGTPLGSLPAGQAKTLRSGPHPRHMLIAEARPGPRKWNVVMNVLVDNGDVCHGFSGKHRKNLNHKGTLTKFLHEEHSSIAHLWQWQPRH